MRRQSIASVLAFAAVLGVGIATLGMLYAVNPAGSAWYPKCPLYSLTGLHCPGCGGLRGAHQLLQGNFAAAFRMNALAFLLLPPLALTWLVNLFRKPRYRRSGGDPRPSLFPNWIGWALLVVVVTFAIARNIPCEPFVYLAPG
jgi:hypothetical protein